MPILAGYKHEKIEAYISAQKRWKDRTKIIVESEPRGTGGALKNAADKFSAEKEFVVVANGDTITNMDLSRMKLDKRSSAVISLIRLRSSKGIVETEGSRLVSFVEKPLLNYWMSAGITSFQARSLRCCQGAAT
ncbi:MAG: sugar phosphate nucleotidyltransferase [Candidatus Micrarchaeaceae archaeon]